MFSRNNIEVSYSRMLNINSIFNTFSKFFTHTYKKRRGVTALKIKVKIKYTGVKIPYIKQTLVSKSFQKKILKDFTAFKK